MLHTTVDEALHPVHKYGKKDTLGMDAGPEITITQELENYDRGAVIVTEEIGSKGMQHEDTFRSNDPQSFRTVFVCDPTDRSNQLRAFLTKLPLSTQIGDIFGNESTLKLWEDLFSGPASITGASSAISCIRRGVPIFSVILNYITKTLNISCAAGNRTVCLPDKLSAAEINLDFVLKSGEKIEFPGIGGEVKSVRRFVTFLGDTGKVGYKENFVDSGLMSEEELNSHIHYAVPGGPPRTLYLSSLQPKSTPIGFILANGEKIGEWIHWLPFVLYAKRGDDESQPALHLYEVYQDRPWTKEGILMSTPPNYSIFRTYGKKMYVDTSWLLRMPNPSQLRSTLIVAPHDNRWALRASSQSGYRRITFNNH